MFIRKYDKLLVTDAWLFWFLYLTLPAVGETLFFKVFRRVFFRFSELRSDISSKSGYTVGLRYSWDVVLLVIDCDIIGSIFGVSVCWGCWFVEAFFWRVVWLGSTWVMVIMLACSRWMRSRSISIAMISSFLLFAFPLHLLLNRRGILLSD